MATSNKIVDTRRLAAQGRFGDTKIRNVRGEGPAHVTALEAYHMDTVGVQPSASKKSINPMSGLPEYHGAWGIHKSKHPGHHNIGEIIGAGLDIFNPVSRAGKVYELVTGKESGLPGSEEIFEGTYGESLGDWWTESITDPLSKTEREIEAQSKDIMTGGMESLKTQYGQYMGPEGFLTREQDIREKGLKSTYDIAMGGYDLAGEKLDLSGKKLSESTGASYKQLGDVGNVQRSKSNLAYSGAIEGKVREGKKAIGKQYALGIEDIALGRENIALGRTGTQSTYDIGMETSALGAEKSEADFMAGLRKQMNVMMTDYLSATGEAYGDTGAGSMWEELNTLFDTYSENV